MERYELVIRFFREIGAAREAEMYLKLFHKGEANRFAVIEVAEDLSPFSLNVLALHLAFLSSLDLYPVVVHGASAARPEDGAGMWKWLQDGSRASWQGIRDATLAMNETLISAINLHDGNAMGMTSGIFSGDGKIRVASINRAIRSDAIPVVAALSVVDRSLRPVPLAAAVKSLVQHLKPRKIIRVCESGALTRADGSTIDYVNLKLDESSGKALDYYRNLLEPLSHRSVVQVTSASNLPRELFTQKGGGTLIKLGRNLRVHDGLEGLSRQRLRKLIERSFGKKLRSNYFTQTKKMVSFIIDPDYKGVAIVREIDGLAYLDKFAVRPDARGEGIAVDLWTILLARHPKIFWRSRPTNPFNAWYFEKATGMAKFEEWYVWWKGMSPRQAQAAIKIALQVETTLD